jgi:uncharacterized protein YdeI (YjbR/CyaY-like superfamily)
MSKPPIFFPGPEEFRAWLQTNHDKESALLVGFYKVATGKPSMTWEQSVEEALCFGWIDGVRKGVDGESYTIRFTPRRPDSIWSKKNIETVTRLTAEGRMQPSGLKAFEARRPEKSGYDSFTQEQASMLGPELERRFQGNKAAWEFFLAQPPGYQKTMRLWVMSAKRDDTRLKRLDRLIEVSAQSERVDLMSPFGKKNPDSR